jgi:serine/threonine protein kinase
MARKAKPFLVLVDVTENGTVRMEGICIADLGLLYHSRYKSRTGRRVVVGSFPYIAPEVIEYGEITPLSDVWAVGCIAYELCTGLQLPHTRGLRVIDAQNIKDYAQNITLSEFPSKFDIVMRDTIVYCLTWDPSTRPTAKQVLNDIMRKFNTLDIDLSETCCLLPMSDSPPITISEAISIQDLDDKREESDDDWMLLFSHDAFNRDIVGHNIEAEPTRLLESTPSAGQLSLLQSPEMPFDFNEMLMDQYGWTTGEEASLLHRQIIDGGASGEVHEVRKSLAVIPKRCLSNLASR